MLNLLLIIHDRNFAVKLRESCFYHASKTQRTYGIGFVLGGIIEITAEAPCGVTTFHEILAYFLRCSNAIRKHILM